MKKSLISIIVPIYNAKDTLERCLKSLISQSYKNIEIICIDDASTDASSLLLEAFATKDKRIKIIKNKENKGIAYSRNIGLKAALGEYIMWCDSDDWYENNMCKEMYRAISSSNTEMAICNVKPHYEDNNIRTTLKIDTKQSSLNGVYEVNFSLFEHITCYLWNKIFKKSLLDKYNLEIPSINTHEDYIFVNIISMLVNKICFVNKALYNYSIRANSTIDKLFEKNATLIEHLELKAFSTYIPQILKEKKLEHLYPIYNELYFRKISECIQNLKAMSQVYALNNLKDDFSNIYGNSKHSNLLMNVCFACDDNYIEQLATAITSILTNSSHLTYFNFYVLDGGISQKNKKKIEKLKKLQDFYIEFIPIDFEYVRLLPNNLDYISSATYFRYFIPLLKPDLEKILYLDCDMIVKTPLKELYNMEFDDNYVIAVKDSWHKHEFADKHKIQNYFNAGMLLINNKKWKEDDITMKLVKNTLLFKNEISYGDQDILNYTFNKKVKNVSSIYNMQSFSHLFEETKSLSDDEIENLLVPTIIHYTNREKPWNTYRCIHPYALEYFYYNKIANDICKFRKKSKKEI